MRRFAVLGVIVGALVFAGVASAAPIVSVGGFRMDPLTHTVTVPFTYQCDPGAVELVISSALAQGWDAVENDYAYYDEEWNVVPCSVEAATVVLTYSAPKLGPAHFDENHTENGIFGFWFTGIHQDVILRGARPN